ncbi:inactive peptidyl-prolyl cis-trans isomerase shutdown [Bradysia coprophila]|uniref:inactive peptidyl-prolyl cis-trans isomerase shutdown n=1 Tax=Bradysia coprophila TaxID=38358 RepID=UPI00187DD778|nr:inactive peptidyl-prolyl cis-trans isomerase shutdown [Bradysia coprophila]
MPVDDYYNANDLELENPLNFGDLLNKGARFTLQSNLQECNEDDELFPELMTGEEGIPFEQNEVLSPWDQPFAELIPLMTELKLTDMLDGTTYTIYKRIVKPPVDKVEISGRCRVTVDYNAYGERKTIPFDSTSMRGVPFTFETDDKSILPGFLEAVASMKREEESQFIIPYQLLYGKHGCEPRVEKEADALFVIRLIKFIHIGDEDATEKIVNNEDRKKYSVMISHVMDVKASGIDYFQRGAYVKAASAFHKAIKSLSFCRLANEEEEKECQEHLIKLHVNAMTAYNKMDNPRKACLIFNDLSRISDTKTNVKALFQHGKALISLCEYERAKSSLKRANQLKPSDNDIVNQLKILNEKHNTYKNAELNLWRKAFGNDEPVVPAQASYGVTEEFKETVQRLVTDFNKNPNESRKHIPSHLNNDEKAYIRDLIKDFNMKLVIPEVVQGKKICYLSK